MPEAPSYTNRPNLNSPFYPHKLQHRPIHVTSLHHDNLAVFIGDDVLGAGQVLSCEKCDSKNDHPRDET